MLLMTIGNLIELGFAFLVAVGLLLLLAGVVLLVRWKTTSAPGAKITVWNIEVENAGPGLLVMLVGLGVIIAGGYFLTQAIEHTQSPTPVSPAGSATPSAAAVSSAGSSSGAFPFARITYPRRGTQVSRHKGFVEGGTVAALGPDTIWVLDHPSRGVYYIDGPATVNGSSWSFNDYPLGDSSDPLPYSLTVVTVEATPGCASALDRDAKTLAIPKIEALPHGCDKFAGVTVNVTRP
jgi:hypothetical protein